MYDGPSFDFGKYAIPGSFFEQDDSFLAMDSLLGSEFATISQYLCDGESRLLLFNVQKGMDLNSYGGLFTGANWIWFGIGKFGENVLAGAFHQLRDGVLYCLLDPSLISGYPSSLKAVTVNPDVLDSISEESNYIIAKIQLKR